MPHSPDVLALYELTKKADAYFTNHNNAFMQMLTTGSVVQIEKTRFAALTSFEALLDAHAAFARQARGLR